MIQSVMLASSAEFIPEFPQSQSVQCGGNILGGSSLGMDHKRGNNNLLAVRVDGERIKPQDQAQDQRVAPALSAATFSTTCCNTSKG